MGHGDFAGDEGGAHDLQLLHGHVASGWLLVGLLACSPAWGVGLGVENWIFGLRVYGFGVRV